MARMFIDRPRYASNVYLDCCPQVRFIDTVVFALRCLIKRWLWGLCLLSFVLRCLIKRWLWGHCLNQTVTLRTLSAVYALRCLIKRWLENRFGNDIVSASLDIAGASSLFPKPPFTTSWQCWPFPAMPVPLWTQLGDEQAQQNNPNHSKQLSREMQ